MCGYPQLVTQVHVLNAEGLQGQDSNGGKTSSSELRPGSQHVVKHSKSCVASVIRRLRENRHNSAISWCYWQLVLQSFLLNVEL